MRPDRSAALAAVKLRGLIGAHLGAEIGEPERFGVGAAVVHDGAGWIYVPDEKPSLGMGLAWVNNAGARTLNVIVDSDGGSLAFAAGGFAAPEPAVWLAEGRSLTPVEPLVPEIEPPPTECTEFTELLVSAGLDVVPDHGVWLGELNGLELARVGLREGFCGIDIGVGVYDQFASAAIDADRSPLDKLTEVVDLVRPHRTAGSRPHAIGRLVRARWLRSQAVARPESIGVGRLEPTPLLNPRPGLTVRQPAAAIGERGSRTVIAVFAVGVDLRVADEAAALAEFHRADEIVVVMPARDHHALLVAAVDLLGVPARLAELEGEWSD